MGKDEESQLQKNFGLSGSGPGGGPASQNGQNPQAENRQGLVWAYHPPRPAIATIASQKTAAVPLSAQIPDSGQNSSVSLHQFLGSRPLAGADHGPGSGSGSGSGSGGPVVVTASRFAGGAPVAAVSVSDAPNSGASSSSCSAAAVDAGPSNVAADFTHEQIVKHPALFAEALRRFHDQGRGGTAQANTKCHLSLLELYTLYVEITKRGGMRKVITDRKWEEVLKFFPYIEKPSFLLRTTYFGQLEKFENHYFLSKPSEQETTQNGDANPAAEATPVPIRGGRKRRSPMEAAAGPTPNAEQIVGVIEGKFDFGYWVKVIHGGETLQGVLYHVSPEMDVQPGMDDRRLTGVRLGAPATEVEAKAEAALEPESSRNTHKKKRARAWKNNPEHPRPIRTGYNFFFGEQHARMKAMNEARDRDVSKRIGDLWKKLPSEEKQRYQILGGQDKERYQREMKEYAEKSTANANNAQSSSGVQLTDANANVSNQIQNLNSIKNSIEMPAASPSTAVQAKQEILPSEHNAEMPGGWQPVNVNANQEMQRRVLNMGIHSAGQSAAGNVHQERQLNSRATSGSSSMAALNADQEIQTPPQKVAMSSGNRVNINANPGMQNSEVKSENEEQLPVHSIGVPSCSQSPDADQAMQPSVHNTGNRTVNLSDLSNMGMGIGIIHLSTNTVPPHGSQATANTASPNNIAIRPSGQATANSANAHQEELQLCLDIGGMPSTRGTHASAIKDIRGHEREMEENNGGNHVSSSSPVQSMAAGHSG